MTLEGRGPKAELAILTDALAKLAEGFADLPESDPESGAPRFGAPRSGAPGSSTLAGEGPGNALERAALIEALGAAATRMRDNYPYHHPLYAGQMLKPPHPAARLAYALSLWINPNNHALDGGRASSAMEKEAVADLARIVGWETCLGHLCGGGTMANMEALWAAGQLAPGRIAVSAQAHYTHRRIGEVLGLDCIEVATDDRGRMDAHALGRLLDQNNGDGGRIGTVIVTLGTTGLGAVDPLEDILALRADHGFRLHIDAAYGGYFALTGDALTPKTRAAFACMGEADSLVIDPHKHGLQPYGCGCVLFRDPAVGALYRHDSPYTYFTSNTLHLGEISLECSRPGAAAVALWTTHQVLPPKPGGAFADDLARCLGAARGLHTRLDTSPNWLVVIPPELDILVWAPAGRDGTAISAASRQVFEAAARRDLHLALIELPADLLRPHWPGVTFDGVEAVTCLRSCLMKPEHLDWLDKIMATLEDALGDTAGDAAEAPVAGAGR